MARDQVIRELALRSRPGDEEPRVRSWSDLWRWVASTVRNRPALLSEASAAAVFDQAVGEVEAEGRLGAVADLVVWPGYRRRLRQRLRDWTTAEQRVDDAQAAARDAAEWAVFERYRRLLKRLDAEDEAGLSVWASHRLRERNARSSSADGDRIVFLDFEGRDRPRWRVLTDVLERPRSVDVTLSYSDDPALAELYLATGPTRGRLLELGLIETPLPSNPQRPAGLRTVDQSLFRADASRDARIESSDGLAVWGGPEGEDFGRLVAREVCALLAQGVDPDEVLLVFPRWDDQAEIVCEVVRKAGAPVHDAGPRALDLEPSVTALLLAARIPPEDWDVELVVRLLRHGQLRPEWDDIDRLTLAEVASILRETPVFRGSRQIVSAIERAMGRNEEKEPAREERRLARLKKAHEVLELLIGVLDPLNRSAPWSEHASALRRAAETLGLGTRDRRALETLWDALEDRGEVLEKLGRGAQTIPWRAFVDKMATMAAETPSPVSPPPPGTIRTAVVDDIGGCRASHVFLVGLVEGSFPRRSAVQSFLELRPGDVPSPSARSNYAREMLRFVQALGAGERGVSLFYPTTDAKGQPLLRAGFLDDLLATLSPQAESTCHRSYARFHPALLDREDLAVTPADIRVLASALAGEQGRSAKLRALAGDRAHRAVLEGAAAALVALEHRRRGTPFSAFEGLIGDQEAVADIARAFQPEIHTFSPSQLETYIDCPFKFFSRHVLHLKPVEERDELAEDPTERGSRLHDILEEFEKRRAEAVEDASDDLLLVAAIDKVLSRELVELSELDLGLRELEYGQIQRIITQYARQRSAYESESPSSPVPQWFEYGFGEPDDEHPDFQLSLGAEIVKLRGRIDRIDRIETEAGPKFRVIDYKSGLPPSSKDVIGGRMLQLPLYAMAVEKLLFERGEVGLLDVGYWSLKNKGYKPIVLQEWEEFRRTLVERVFDVIGRLRTGDFVVSPRKEGCEAYCEYRGVCRIRQVRAAEKLRSPEPTISTETTAAGRKPRTARNSKKTADET